MRARFWLWWLYGVAMALPALVIGLTTAQADYPFGPHEATYHVTVDSRLTVDLGPLGAVVMESPLPGPVGFLGGRVEVGPIPADSADPADTALPSISMLAGDLTEYGQAYLGIGQTVRQAIIDLAVDGLVRAGIVWASVLIATVLFRLALGRSRRIQIAMWARRHKRAAAGAVAGIVAAGLGIGSAVVWAAQPTAELVPEPLLADTPLAGAQMTGRLGQLIGQYGSVAVDAYEDAVTFYDQAAASVEAAFADQALAAAGRIWGLPGSPAATAAGSSLSASSDPGGTDGGDSTGGEASAGSSGGQGASSEAGGGLGADSSPGAASGALSGAPSGRQSGLPSGVPLAEPSPTPPWLSGRGPYGDLRPVLFFSDLHCNVGMAQVVGAAAGALGTTVVLDGGDTTMDGTAMERYCVDQIAAALPAKATWVSVIGNHDSSLTATQERSAGATVLAGKVETVAGLRILGDADPNRSEMGQATRLRGEESAADVSARLAKTACADGSVDLLLVHEPVMAMGALEAGCVPAAVTGHMHTRADPRVVGRGIFYTQASTGRDNAETTNLGPLGSPAEMTILLFDADGRVAAWQLLTVYPDASAKLSSIKAWPALPKAPPPGQSADNGGAPPGAS
ncbi:MAG: metallophosphoesterase [Bifidobacteriaceae bacterium]|jgi:hypothetical protein|nr:metallophosphoesterase [Bifidobacteriaceae bacterium]